MFSVTSAKQNRSDELTGFCRAANHPLMGVGTGLMHSGFWSDIVTDISSTHPENYVLGDIGGMIRNAF
jgi:hypothetical protein